MFEWQDTMSVGIREFDGHHKRIIELINKLQDALSRGDNRNAVQDVLTEVANYTIYHFFAEEALMEKYRYADYARHRQEHLALTEKTFQLMGDARNNKADIGTEVLDFLVTWLKTHILVSDKEYSGFFRSQGLS